jgi:hypothetical protein
MRIYILRGISGSGKSTEAMRLALFKKEFICSADDYFMKDGVYQFDPALLSYVHNQCLQKYISLVFAETPTIVVDNTNTTWAEMKPYWEVAMLTHAVVKFVEFKPEKNDDGTLNDSYLVACASRNTHGVSLVGVRRQAERFEYNIPTPVLL